MRLVAGENHLRFKWRKRGFLRLCSFLRALFGNLGPHAGEEALCALLCRHKHVLIRQAFVVGTEAAAIHHVRHRVALLLNQGELPRRPLANRQILDISLEAEGVLVIVALDFLDLDMDADPAHFLHGCSDRATHVEPRGLGVVGPVVGLEGVCWGRGDRRRRLVPSVVVAMV